MRERGMQSQQGHVLGEKDTKSYKPSEETTQQPMTQENEHVENSRQKT